MSKNGLIDARTEKTTDVWLTPKPFIDLLGPFDLDPCHLPDGERPFDTAATHFCASQNGLAQDWGGYGTVWLNAPYETRLLFAFTQKLAEHGNGISLQFARTETASFRLAWRTADAMLFLGKRVQFIRHDGLLPSKANSAAPSVLIAWGQECARRLEHAAQNGLEGALVRDFRYIGGKEKVSAKPIIKPHPSLF